MQRFPTYAMIADERYYPGTQRQEKLGERFFRLARSRNAGVAALRQVESDAARRKKIRLDFLLLGAGVINMRRIMGTWIFSS